MQSPPLRVNHLFLITLFGFASATLASGQVLNENFKLLAEDGAEGDRFGSSVAISNGIVAIGAWARDIDKDTGNAGAAYLFDLSTGEQIHELLASDREGEDSFGWSIAFSDGIVVVGASWSDDFGSKSGSAYIFDASTGDQLFKLLPDDGEAEDWFGNSVAIADGIVAVGAPRDNDNGLDSGSVYLFDAATGAQIAKVLPADGGEEDLFGFSIALDDGVLAVGAYRDKHTPSLSGSVYLFDVSTGNQLAKITPEDGIVAQRFGYSVALDDGVLAVGAAPGFQDTPLFGAAYLFTVATGTQIARLTADDGAPLDNLGYSISINKGIVAVGTPDHDDNNINSGSAYLFDASTGEQLAKLLTNNGGIVDLFGWSIAIENGIVVVGTNFDDDLGNDSGSASVFDLNCFADFTGDGNLNFFDISAFLAAFNAQYPIADLTGDGHWNFFDVSAYLQLFNAGCP